MHCGSCGGDTNDINQDKVIADTESNVVTRRGSVTALGPAQLPPDTKIASRCLESWRAGEQGRGAGDVDSGTPEWQQAARAGYEVLRS